MTKEVRIVEDDGIKIVYQEVSTSDIDRQEVESIELALAQLEQEVVEKNDKIEALKEKLKFANEIIALADAAKQQSTEQIEVVDTDEN